MPLFSVLSVLGMRITPITVRIQGLMFRLSTGNFCVLIVGQILIKQMTVIVQTVSKWLHLGLPDKRMGGMPDLQINHVLYQKEFK